MKKGYLDTLSSKKIIKDQSLLRHEDIRHQILILPELKALIPPLLPDELSQLENNIRKDGCREALLVWETTGRVLKKTNDDTPLYVLVDGHNRHGICQRNGIDFRVSLKDFSGIDEVRTFMIENQLGRRNLTPEQTAYLRGLRYRDEKGNRGKYDRAEHKGQNVLYADSNSPESLETTSEQAKKTGRTSTAEKLAKQYSVNEKTIKRDAAFAAGVEKLSPELKASVLSGKLAVNKTLLQQIGKTEIAEGSISSFDEVEIRSALSSELRSESSATLATSGPESTSPKSKTAKSMATLRDQLKNLSDRIAIGSDIDVLLCDEIISSATQLKATLLKNHRKENH